MKRKRVLEHLGPNLSRRGVARWGKQLAAALNVPGATAHPLGRLVVLAQQLADSSHTGRPFDDDKKLEAIEKMEKAINRVTTRFPGYYAFAGLDVLQDTAVFFEFRPLRKNWRSVENFRFLRAVVAMAQAGALWKIRRCKWVRCRLHFCAKDQQQVFHDVRCKAAHKRSQEKFKKRNLDYQFNYYQTHFAANPKPLRSLDK